MCLTGMPSLHAGFGRGEEASLAALLGGLKCRGGRSCHSRGCRHHHRGAVSAAGPGRTKPGPCCSEAPSAPRTAPDTAPSTRGRADSCPFPAGPLSPCPPALPAPCPLVPLPRRPLSQHSAVPLFRHPAVSVPPCPAFPALAAAGFVARERSWALPQTSALRPALPPQFPRRHTRNTHPPRHGDGPRHAPPQTGHRFLDPPRRRAGVPGMVLRRGCPPSAAEGWRRSRGKRCSEESRRPGCVSRHARRHSRPK